jgi:hypothetical protein
MSLLYPAFAVIGMAIAGLLGHDCCRPSSSVPIVLHEFSEGNYAALNRGLNNSVCVTGRLSIDSMGVYYPLQPVEQEGAIDIGFSRVNTGLSRSLASRKGLRDGRVYTICGVLKDSTPFKGCDNNHCRWYVLTNAEPRRNLREKRP